MLPREHGAFEMVVMVVVSMVKSSMVRLGLRCVLRKVSKVRSTYLVVHGFVLRRGPCE